MRIRNPMKHLLMMFLSLVLALPLAVMFTWLLLPFWNWLENTFSIESVGHSGPAAWCFVAMFVACIVALGSLHAFRARDGRSAAE